MHGIGLDVPRRRRRSRSNSTKMRLTLSDDGAPKRTLWRCSLRLRPAAADGTRGTVRAWKATGPVNIVTNVAICSLDLTTGACNPGNNFSGYTVVLTEITPPPNFTGPLTVD